MAHNGDPVMDAKGKVVGKVTSCAIDKEGFLTGQAFVETRCAVVDTPISIFQGAENLSPVSPASLEPGDRISLPTPAVVVSRFPIS